MNIKDEFRVSGDDRAGALVELEKIFDDIRMAVKEGQSVLFFMARTQEDGDYPTGGFVFGDIQADMILAAANMLNITLSNFLEDQ